MKKDIHPADYREVAFKDMSNDEVFITRSTVAARETIEIDGVTYPLVKLEITSSSHPFFTGKQKLVDTAGRVDKFMSRYGNRTKRTRFFTLAKKHITAGAHFSVALSLLYLPYKHSLPDNRPHA